VWTRVSAPPVQQLERYDGVRTVLAGRIHAPLDHEGAPRSTRWVLLPNGDAETAAWRDAHRDLELIGIHQPHDRVYKPDGRQTFPMLPRLFPRGLPHAVRRTPRSRESGAG